MHFRSEQMLFPLAFFPKNSVYFPIKLKRSSARQKMRFTLHLDDISKCQRPYRHSARLT